MALALARLMDHPSFRLADQQALTSLLSFLVGACTARIGDRIGASTRAWLCLGTFIQALFTMAAALCAWRSGAPSIPVSKAVPDWTNVLTFAAIGFMSATTGLQAVMSMRLKSQFGTTSTYFAESN